MKFFTEQEDSFLKENYRTIPAKRMAKMLGRSEGTARQRMKLLGIKVPKNIIEKFKRESQFTKGHEPLNKGVPMREWMSKDSLARSAKTRFKKGQRVHNEKWDQAIVIRHNHKERGEPGYKWIRVSKANWRAYHVYVWEKAHGSIPNGMIVVFKDRNTMNCNIENLELISREENMRRNTIHRYPPELKFAIRTLKKLNKIIHNGKK